VLDLHLDDDLSDDQDGNILHLPEVKIDGGPLLKTPEQSHGVSSERRLRPLRPTRLGRRSAPRSRSAQIALAGRAGSARSGVVQLQEGGRHN